MAKSRVVQKRAAGIPLHRPRDSPHKKKILLHLYANLTNALCYDKHSQSYEVCRWQLGWVRYRKPNEAELLEAKAIHTAMLARRRKSKK